MKIILAAIALLGLNTIAADVPVQGNVQMRCLITTDIPGVYGNPTPQKLSTAVADGGVLPVVRYDVTLADNYKAKITTPTSNIWHAYLAIHSATTIALYTPPGNALSYPFVADRVAENQVDPATVKSYSVVAS